MNKYSQSVFDYVVLLLPEFIKQPGKHLVDPKVAKKLFSIWQDEDNRIDKKTFNKPVTMSVSDVSAMEKANLVKSIGSNIEITEKGADVIKVMLLGDEKSIFEDDNTIVDYEKALAKVKSPNVRTAGKQLHTAGKFRREVGDSMNKQQNKQTDNWWSRFTG